MPDSLDLTGEVAIVTGGGRGLGRCFALEIAKAGGSVALVGRTAATLDGVAAEVRAEGGCAATFVADVRDSNAAAATVVATEDELGPVTILVNNAALLSLGAVSSLDPQEFWNTMTVNVLGPLVWTRAVLPGMLARRAGRIVNVTSAAGEFAQPNGAAYCCSKAALTRFTSVLGLETVGTGVVTFALAPLARTESSVMLTTAPELTEEQRAFFTMLLEEPERLLDDSLQLFRKMLSGQLDHVSGRYLDSSRPLDEQLVEARDF